MQIKNIDKRKVFLTTLNAGIQTIATGFEYDAEWLSLIGDWFVYISGDRVRFIRDWRFFILLVSILLKCPSLSRIVLDSSYCNHLI